MPRRSPALALLTLTLLWSFPLALHAQDAPSDSLAVPSDSLDGSETAESSGSNQYALNAYRVQPEVWHFSGPLEPGVGAYGDLSLSVPVMTVPGRGMNFDITFGYQSGITMNQRASWVGLGWSFDPGSITREPEGGAIETDNSGVKRGYGVDAFDYNSYSSGMARQPDVYYVTLPGHGTVEVTQSNIQGYYSGFIPSVQAGAFVVNERTPWNITATMTAPVRVGNTSGSNMCASPTYAYCTTGTQTSRNGTFQARNDISSFTVTTEDGTRYVFASPTLSYMDTMWDPDDNVRQIYVNTWRLVAILGTDWKGSNMNAPGDADTGTWIRFDYGNVATKATTSNNGSSNAVYGLGQTQYLAAIETPTHKAVFSVTGRLESTVEEHEYDGNYYKKLTGIKLFNKLFSLTTPVEEVVLNSDQGLGPYKFTTGPGRLRLKSLDFYGEGGKAQHDLTGDRKRPGYAFQYSNNDTALLSAIGHCVDHFGYYNKSYLNSCGDSSTLNTGDPTRGGQWSLTRIDYPTGGYDEFTYETDRIDIASVAYVYDGESSTSDTYLFNTASKDRQGGARVTQIKRSDGMTSPATTTYTYGTGHSTGVPPGYWMKHSMATVTGGALRHYRSSSRGKVGVVYASVTQTHPDNSTTTTYYTTSSYGSTVQPVKTVLFTQSHYAKPGTLYCNEATSGPDILCRDMAVVQGNEHWNWGKPYKTEYKENASGTLVLVKAVNHAVNLTRYDKMLAYAWGKTAGEAREVLVHWGGIKVGSSPGVAVNAVLTETTTDYGSGTSRAKEVKYEYDWSTGQLVRVTERGELLQKLTEITRAYKKYTGMQTANMLSQVAREDVYEQPAGGGTSKYLSSTVTTWKSYTVGTATFWKPHRVYLWRDADNVLPSTALGYTTWDAAQSPTDTQWILASLNETYDQHGRVTQRKDARGFYTKLYYGDNASPYSNTATGLKNAYLTGVRVMKAAADDETNDLKLALRYSTKWGAVSQVTDEGLTDTYFDYDVFGRLWKERHNGTDVASEYTYTYPVLSGSTITTPGHVVTKRYTGSATRTSRTYYDGLARLIQTLQETGSDDVITALTYDAQGRPSKAYKPYLQTGTTHGYRSGFDAEAKAYYDGDPGPVSNSRPFAETRYRIEPLGRARVVLPEGTSSESASTRLAYGIESMTLPWDGTSRAYTYTETSDELNKKVRTYTDAVGNTMRTTAGYGGTTTATSYMQYDVLGRLVKTYAPEWVSTALSSHTTSYTYNTLSQLTARTSSDAGTVQHKYDKAGNLRFSQDANQSAAGRVLFTSYDFANRALTTGEATATFSTLDPDVVQGFEGTNANWLTVRHYDTKPSTSAFPWSLAAFVTDITNATMSNLKGRLAATAEKSGGKWQITLYSYDTRGRVQTKKVLTEDLAATKTTFTYTYNRQSELTQLQTTVGTSSFYHWYTYNARGLLSLVYFSTGSTRPPTPNISYTYTPPGQIASQYLGGTTIPTTYTIRDWVDTIDDLAAPTKSFAAEYLYYADGNVQEAQFKQTSSPAANKHYRYVYSYDDLKRLTSADYAYYTTAWQTSASYDETVSLYDKNGNLKALQRYRETGTLLDNLTYSYTAGTNRLASISDAVATTSETWDAESGSFSYDANGNLKTAPAPYSITAATYDTRNLPLSLTRSGTTTSYRYSDSGQRYYKKVGTAAAEHYIVDGATTMGLFSDTGTRMHWNIVAAGRVVGRYEGSTSKYYLADALGSVRMVLSGSTVVEVQDYYAWGLQMPGRSLVSGTSVREKYTGKERDAETGLDYFGARYYMAVLGRWGSVDPMADLFPGWSPYNYAMNNPLLFIDPTGMVPENAGQCPPNCDLGGVMRQTFGWAEQAFNQTSQKVSEAMDAAKETVADVTETVVKEGSEALDKVTMAASTTAIVAIGAAGITGGPVPTPDDAVHLTAAGAAGLVATTSTVAAAILSSVDAAFYGRDPIDANARVQGVGVGIFAGGLAGIAALGYLRTTLMSQVQRTATVTAVSTTVGEAASQAAQKTAEELQRR